MGVNLLNRSWSTFDSVPYKPLAGNPDPENFKIIQSQMVLGHVVIEIQYPDALNYEGRKILFFKNCKLSKIRSLDNIDPHFSSNKDYPSPFARFEPTPEGWNAAILLASTIG